MRESVKTVVGSTSGLFSWYFQPICLYFLSLILFLLWCGSLRTMLYAAIKFLDGSCVLDNRDGSRMMGTNT